MGVTNIQKHITINILHMCKQTKALFKGAEAMFSGTGMLRAEKECGLGDLALASTHFNTSTDSSTRETGNKKSKSSAKNT